MPVLTRREPSHRSLWTVPAIAALVACGQSSLSNRHADIAVMPPALDFGTVNSLSPLSKQFTVSNTGTATLHIQGITVNEDTEHVFSVLSPPTQVDAQSSAAVTVVMTPAASGLYGASLVIASDANNAPQVLVQLSVRVDVAGTDAGSMDAGTADAGVDAGSMDAGVPDAGAVDSGQPDAGVVDAGMPDAGVEDAGTTDAGGSCPDGLTMCGSQCVDARIDPNHCGMCDHFCGTMNMGCVDGMCVTCAPTQGYTTLASKQGQPWGIAVDQNNVYWTAQTDQTIVKVGINGGTPATLVDASEFSFPESFQPTSIAIDPNRIYFGNETMQSVMDIGILGGTPMNLGGTGAWPSKLAVTSSAVYWVTSTTGDLWKASLPAGPASIIAPGPGSSGVLYEMLGVDSSSVYWIAQGSGGAIMKVSLSGGTPQTLASGVSWPRDGAVDATSIYWTDTVDGMVLKMPSAGGTLVTLAQGLASPRNLIVDGSTLYWSAGGTDSSLMSCNGTVQSVSINGGPVTNVAEGQYSAMGVAVDATSVYWTDLYYGTIMKTPKP